MSTESIAETRSLRQFLAREAQEKETSIRQSPVIKTGSKITTPLGAQKKMHKERRGNSQVNVQKKIKTHKNTKNKIIVIRKTTWRVKEDEADRKRRERKKMKTKKLFRCRDRIEETTTFDPSITYENFAEMETPESSQGRLDYVNPTCTISYSNFKSNENQSIIIITRYEFF